MNQKDKILQQKETYIEWLLDHPYATCWTFQNTLGNELWKARRAGKFFNLIKRKYRYASK